MVRIVLLLLISMPAWADDDEKNMLSISEAIRSGASFVKLSTVGISQVEEENIEEAKDKALQNAFQKMVELAAHSLVSDERLHEAEALVSARIYQRARNFISHFRSFSPEISGSDYRLPVEVTLRLSDLYKVLVEQKIILINYDTKRVLFLNIKEFNSYQFIRDVLEKEVRNLKRISETYQRKKEIHLLIETSSSVDEIIHVLEASQKMPIPNGAPHFSTSKNAMGVLEIKLLE